MENCQYNKEYSKKWRAKNKSYSSKYKEEKKDQIKKVSKKWRDKNPTKLAKYGKDSYLKNRERILEKQSQYAKNNRKKRSEYSRLWREKNKDRLSKQKRERYLKNKKPSTESQRLRARTYVRNRRKHDILFRLTSVLRGRHRYVLKHRPHRGSAVRDLGITPTQFKAYLESHWSEGMSWDNYGNRRGCWSMDHTIPLSSFDLTKIEEFKKACHYTNIRPMWHIENIKKGNKT